MTITPTADPICMFLRDTRTAKGLSQREVAERAGTSRETVNAWECGRISPTLIWLRRWAEALNVTLTPASTTLPATA